MADIEIQTEIQPVLDPAPPPIHGATPQEEEEADPASARDMATSCDLQLTDVSFRPPTHASSSSPLPRPWVLLDIRAYIAECRKNGTTASGTTSGGQPIEVTLCLADPPAVSHFCVHCPGMDLENFAMEPKVLASEGDLLLLNLVISPRWSASFLHYEDYFIYKARGSEEEPSLSLIPKPPTYPRFSDDQIGLLRTDGGGGGGGGHYVISTLCFKFFRDRGHAVYGLHLFHSLEGEWRSKEVSLDIDISRNTLCRAASKVITIGGEGGAVGWVDLWQGILVCNLLEESPMLRYIPLPMQDPFQGCGNSARDIVVVQGRVKFFAIKSIANCQGWDACKWSWDANSWEWNKDCSIRDFSILMKGLSGQEDNCGTLPIPMRSLAGLPALSLDNDDLVFIMTKVEQADNTAWMVALDMREKTLQGVTTFGAERTMGFNLNTYLQSGISNHL